MSRLFVTLSLFAVLAGWTSAQNTTDTAGDRMARFARNRTLVEDLVTRGLDLSNANDPLARATACQQVAADLTIGLQAAADADDPDRVAEVGEYLGTVLKEAVAPALADARNTIPAGSPEAGRLNAMATKATDEAKRAVTLVPTTGRSGKSARVADVKAKLEAAAKGL
jgi:hypothetical protein